MKTLSMLVLMCALPALADCDRTPRTVTGNWEDNLYGDVDVRPNTWGRAHASVKTLTFRPPEGCRVRVTRIRGDLVAWVMFPDRPVEITTDTREKLTKTAGVLLALYPTGPEGSVHADLAEDRTLLYTQHVVAPDRPSRLEYSEIVDVLLPEDHKLHFKMASWLNSTGSPVHAEATWTVYYRFDDGRPMRVSR